MPLLRNFRTTRPLVFDWVKARTLAVVNSIAIGGSCLSLFVMCPGCLACCFAFDVYTASLVFLSGGAMPLTNLEATKYYSRARILSKL